MDKQTEKLWVMIAATMFSAAFLLVGKSVFSRLELKIDVPMNNTAILIIRLDKQSVLTYKRLQPVI